MAGSPQVFSHAFFEEGYFKKSGNLILTTNYVEDLIFFCRFIQHENLTHAVLKNYLIDYDLRDLTKEMIIRHFYESGLIIFRHYGFFAVLRWLIHQKDISRYFSFWFQNFKKSFSGD